MFAVEQGFEFGERGIFLGEQARQVLAGEIGVQVLLGGSGLLVRGDGGEQVAFEAHHLVGDALGIDVVAAFVERATHGFDAGSR